MWNVMERYLRKVESLGTAGDAAGNKGELKDVRCASGIRDDCGSLEDDRILGILGIRMSRNTKSGGYERLLR